MDTIVSTYRRYAPNLDDVTLAVASHSPDATERRIISMRGGDRHHGSFHPDNWLWNRPSAQMPGYRTPIDGLYLCGASQHPGGSFHGQPGYNAAGWSPPTSAWSRGGDRRRPHRTRRTRLTGDRHEQGKRRSFRYQPRRGRPHRLGCDRLGT
jgi:hypothetical protein